jgi:HEAT repeat protein
LTQNYDEETRLKEQINLLVQALESDSDSVRNAVIVQISNFGSRAVPHLMRILDSDLAEELRARKNGEARNSYLELAIDGILKSLGIISDPAAVDIIARAMPRREAVESLAKIGGARSLDLIMGSIGAPLDEFGNQKGGALRNFVDSEQSSSPYNDRFVRNVFTFLGEPAKSRLKEELASPDPKRRAAAASILRVMREKDSIPELTDILKGHDVGAKAEAAHALSELGAPGAGPLLVKELFDIERMIEDLDLSQSKEVSDLLAYSQLREARDVIEKAILDLGDVDVLVEVGFHPARRDASRFSMRPEFRKAIVRKGEISIPALTKFLAAQDKSTQSNAAEIIAQIKKNGEIESASSGRDR